MRRHELSNEQWEKIEYLLPSEKKPQGGRPAKKQQNYDEWHNLPA